MPENTTQNAPPVTRCERCQVGKLVPCGPHLFCLHCRRTFARGGAG